MVVIGVILLVLAIFDIARPLTFPLGATLIVLGLVVDILYFLGHTVTLIF
jgi:hypothetical protein